MDVDVNGIAARSTPGVVGVRAGRRRGTALWLADGQVLTAAHNVRAADVEVVDHQGRTIAAADVTASEDLDLAVVTVAVADGGTVTVLPWAGSPPAVGDAVVAIAAPEGLARTTVGQVATAAGRIRTATGSPLIGVLEHTAPLPRGASGGPVLDREGAVAAIDLNRLDGGLYQAVPLDDHVRTAIAALREGEVPTARRLGVSVVGDRRAHALRAAVGLPPADGVLLHGVDPDGPSAGLLDRGDRIHALDGATIRGTDDLLVALRSAGSSVELAVTRGADPTRTVTVPTG